MRTKIGRGKQRNNKQYRIINKGHKTNTHN